MNNGVIEDGADVPYNNNAYQHNTVINSYLI